MIISSLSSCKKLFPDMSEINYSIDAATKINPNKANGPDIVPAKFIIEKAIECGATSHHLFSAIPAWHTTI